MLEIIFSDIQERVERSMFEAIRKVAVDAGYIPDITNFADDQADTTAFTTALEDIAKLKGFSIEIYGVGSSQSKGIQKVPRIVLITRRFLPTNVGGPANGQFIQDSADPNYYLQVHLPNMQVFMVMDVQMVSNTTKQDRVLHQIIGAALGTRSYVDFYDDQCERFFVEEFSYFDNLNTQEGIITKMYQYKIDNLAVYDMKVYKQKVSKIKEITIDINLVAQNKPITPDVLNPEISDIAGQAHVIQVDT